MAKSNPAPAIHVSLSPTTAEYGVFFKVAPETLQHGDIVAFSAHVLAEVVRVETLNRATVRVHYIPQVGARFTGNDTRDKRRGIATIALIERDGARVATAPAGTRFDR